MIPYENDGRDHYRKEYNDMLLEKHPTPAV